MRRSAASASRRSRARGTSSLPHCAGRSPEAACRSTDSTACPPLRPSFSTGPSARLAAVDIDQRTLEASRFAIGFDHRDRARLHELWDSILDTDVWSEGTIVAAFEDAWAAWNGLPAVAFGGWTGAALAALDYAGVRGETVLCPSNTFMATPLSVVHSGGHVEFVDCIRTDLSMSFYDFEA